MSNKSHGLNENDVLTYEKYLDETNGEQSPDTAPSLIPVLENGSVTLKSFGKMLEDFKVTVENDSLNTNSTIQNDSLTVDNPLLTSADEGLTGAVRVINTDHAYIHDGIGFKAYLDIGELSTTEEYLIRPNEMKYLHFKNLTLQALGGTVKVSIKRGTTANPLVIDSDGSAATELTGPNNLNDVSDATSGVVITKTPTYVDNQNGEEWAVIKVLGDATNQFTSVATTNANDNEELVFKNNTPYILRVEPIGTETPENVFLTTFWYEEAEGLVE